LAAFVVLGVVGLAVALRPGRPVRVSVVHPERADVIETVVTSGTVRPPSRVALGVARVGTVAEVTVDEGAHVAEGQLLVRLDDRTARAAVEEARAGVAEAQARLRRLRATGARVALAARSAARAELARAEEDLARQERLTASGAAPVQRRDEASRARDVATANLARADAEVRAASAGGDDVRLAIANQELAEAALEAAEAALGETRLLAPADGIVLDRHVEPGSVAQPGQALLDFMRDEPPELVVTPEETNLASLRVGQPAVASAEPFPDQRFEAVVERIAPAVDESRGTVEVVLRVPTPPVYLRPGMTVSVEIELRREANALVVPISAIHGLGGGHPEVFVEEEGTARRRALRVGISDAQRVSVLDGLAEGDRVLTHPSRPLEEGDVVRLRRGGS